jgi:hypothetical protein
MLGHVSSHDFTEFLVYVKYILHEVHEFSIYDLSIILNAFWQPSVYFSAVIKPIKYI